MEKLLKLQGGIKKFRKAEKYTVEIQIHLQQSSTYIQKCTRNEGTTVYIWQTQIVSVHIYIYKYTEHDLEYCNVLEHSFFPLENTYIQ